MQRGSVEYLANKNSDLILYTQHFETKIICWHLWKKFVDLKILMQATFEKVFFHIWSSEESCCFDTVQKINSCIS